MSIETSTLRVRKNSGELVPFEVDKLRAALRRSGASEPHINQVIQQVRASLYDGMPTKKIYQLAYSALRKLSDHSASRYRLKKAMMQLGPSGYPFEHFIGKLLESDGYEVKTGQIIQGNCVKHEVDVVASKANKLIMIECKFHRSEGAKSDVKISLYVRSRFTDIEKKLEQSDTHQGISFTPMLVTNTRFTEDAIQFGTCAGMKLVSWDYPAGNGLKERIDRAGLHPITVLKTLKIKETEQLLNQGIVLCKQIRRDSPAVLDLDLAPSRLRKLVREAELVSETR